MTILVSSVDLAPMCESFDSASNDFVVKQQPYIAIEFDVSQDNQSLPMSFGSPDWFRAKDAGGYVADDLTVSVGDCDDAYPEFTPIDLKAGDKHRGWVLFKSEKIKPGNQLTIGWPYGSQSATLTLPG